MALSCVTRCSDDIILQFTPIRKEEDKIREENRTDGKRREENRRGRRED
jgi:hypothetical protein